MTLLSPHFALVEFTRSVTAARRGILNTPNDAEVEALRALCTNVLEPLRARFGPVRVLSGFRRKALNRALGSGDTSQHTKGEAADVTVDGVTAAILAVWALEHTDADQVILEFPGPQEWCHLSYRRPPQANRNQALTAVRGHGGTTQYIPGIHPTPEVPHG